MCMVIIVGGMKIDNIYYSIHNYTKFKLVEMLIKKYKDKKLGNLNAMEELSDDVLNILAICGLKYHQELKNKFEE